MESQIQTYKRYTKKQEQEWSKKWQHLTQDISELILKRLSIRDFLNFGLVCSSWCTMLDNAITNKQCHPFPQIPLLLLCPDSEISEKAPCFLEVNKDTTFRLENHIYLRSQFVLGTINGWLMMAEATSNNYSLFFFNPLSSAKVMLPSKMKDHDQIPRIKKMAASSAPHNNCHDDTIFVVGLADHKIIFCKITSESWNLIEVRRVEKFYDLAIIGNLLYLIVKRDWRIADGIEIYKFDLDKPGKLSLPKAKRLVVPNPMPRRSGRRYYNDIEDIHLLHDVVSGDLMLVVMRSELHDSILDPSPFTISNIKGFKVLKLNKTSNGGVRFVEIKDLGDHLIFLDHETCKLISTVGFMENVRRNCIYFAMNKFRGAHKSWKIDLGMFCLVDRSFHSFHITKSVLQNWDKCLWLTPNLYSS